MARSGCCCRRRQLWPARRGRVRVSDPAEAADLDDVAARCSGCPAQADANASTTRTAATSSLVPLTAEVTT